eukprot:CAMPEP_0115320870 /NCGR_PEP_ID=MMETSP0270-20121206/80556_1 /TAXON_ID=71861 /ORGANISM="Scrippsiella trochoidea, Strain CCMP3099" /LENGTH=414 /DNA_ID=CAMNT_0002740711 /DNA_START=28 /DNA_END=1269 /DNA_ORIENTATION=+
MPRVPSKPSTSPRKGMFVCFPGSDSDDAEAESEERAGSDAELPHAGSTLHRSVRRLQTGDTLDPQGEVDSDADLPHPGYNSQPSLSRVKTFDPFNSPVDGGGPDPTFDSQPLTASTAPASSSAAPPPTITQPAQPAQPAQPYGMVAMPTAVGAAQQQWAPASLPQGGGMMMAPAGAMPMQMVPTGFVQAMVQGPNGQLQMPAQGNAVPMMNMAMPAGMPAGAAMIMVPGGYVGAPNSAGFMPGISLQQATMTAAAPSALLAATGPSSPSAVAPSSRVAAGSPMGSPSSRAQPQTVSCTQEADGVFRVRWTVDARKLKGNDKTVVSPPFEIPSKAAGTFKMMINPTPSKLKGGATFRNSNGKGSVQLKCDTASESKLAIRFSIGDAGQEEPPRGPLEHNFALNGVCGLPREYAEW